MAKTVRWGILGAGSIARKFAAAVPDADGAELVAVGSRAQDRADAFGDAFDIPRRHGSYEALVNDADVDAIYVATPHTRHKDDSLLALAAGKAVLCEKPLTINAAQARELIDGARGRGLFLMEAMWTRFLPAVVRAREFIADGRIGEPRMLMADFGFRTGAGADHRLLNPALGGGGLLDVGVYPVSFAHMLFGPPAEATGAAEIGPTGVDTQAGMVLRHTGGQVSILGCAVRTRTPHQAYILGSEGHIHLQPFWSARELRLARGDESERIAPEFRGNGYNYEIEEVGRCLAAGRTESKTMPLDDSLAVIETMDALRAQWGVRYPDD